MVLKSAWLGVFVEIDWCEKCGLEWSWSWWYAHSWLASAELRARRSARWKSSDGSAGGAHRHQLCDSCGVSQGSGPDAEWAERIVRFRPYHSKDDLLQRGVVTSQIYDRIKGYVIAHREKK